MIHRFSRRAIACALLATTCLSGRAIAQNAGSETMPKNRQELDENGVNWATGEQVNYHTDLSIGPAGPGGLRLVRAQGWGVDTSNYTMTMTGSAGVSFTVAVGQRAITFNYAGGQYVPDDGSGATFVVNSQTQYTLTLEDGTIVVYNSFGIYDSYKARATSVTYPTGEKLTLAYNTIEWCTTTADQCPSYGHAVRLQSVASSLGYQLHYTYARDDILLPLQASNWKRLVSIKAINTTVDPCDPLAGTCTTTQSWPTATYNSGGGVVTLPDGSQWSYTSGTNQFLVKRPSASTANFIVNIDANNRVSSVVRDGMTWTYSFTPGTGIMTAVRTDPLGHQKTVVSDTSVGLPTSITDELGRVTAREYTNKQLTKVTLPEGNYTQYTYDARGNVTQVRNVAKPGSGLSDIVASAIYPTTCSSAATCNQPTSTSDARGNVTDYAYNGDGTPQSVTAPAPTAGAVRPQTRYTYTSITTPGGAVVSKLQSVSQCQATASCAGTADETKATYSWSSQLLPTGATQANGTGTLSATTAFTNNNIGDPVAIDGPLAGAADTTVLRYDSMRRLVGASSPDPDGAGPLPIRAIRKTYNVDGNLSKVEQGTVNSPSDTDWAAMTVLGTMTIAYDSAARPVTKSAAGSDGITQKLTQLSYDGESRLQCSAARMNPATFTSLPVDACTLGTQGSYGPDRISKIVYDSADEVTQAQKAVGTSDAATERTLTYSNNGNVTSLTDAENNRTTYVYDGFDRLSQTQYSSTTKGAGVSNSSDYEQLGYDAASNVISRRLRDGTNITFTFDNLNRATVKTLPSPEAAVSYSYDLLGRLTAASQNGYNLSFGYDALGRQTSDGQGWGTISRSYDLAGRVTRRTWQDGFYVDYDRLLTGEISAVRENGATSGVGVLATYAYDNLGNRTSLTFGNGVVQTYAYDPLSQLTTLTNDLSGTANDLTIGGSSTPIAYNPASQIASIVRSGDAYAWTGHYNVNRGYTVNGLNQYSAAGTASFTYDARGNLTSDGTNSYSYSSENLLKTATGGISLYYDPLGRLSEYDTSSSTRFMSDGPSLAVEVDNPAGNILRRYVRGDGMDELLVWYEGSGTANRRFLSSDERGSIVSATDSSGSLVGINNYDESGIPGSANIGRFQYTGQAWLPELGMQYSKARIYSPTLGRFMQTDPIGYTAGANIYAYVENDPVNWIDPLGTCPVSTVSQIFVCASRPKDPTSPTQPAWERRDNSSKAPGDRLGGNGQNDGSDDKTHPCTPTNQQLGNSGRVHFKFSQVSSTPRGLTVGSNGYARGNFVTDGGYFGRFETTFYGYSVGTRGPSAELGAGESRNLNTFRGANWNISGTLLFVAVSDNFAMGTVQHVGSTDAVSTPGVSLGATVSYTKLIDVQCPAH